MTSEGTIQRSFSIGDSWLYYKVYTGHKTADLVLTEAIGPLAQHMLDEGIIDKWFFIRFADPKFHLRIRFSFKGQRALHKIMTTLNKALLPFTNEELIWKVQLEDYHRELERYGHCAMEETESLFSQDSRFVVNLLSLIEGPEGEELKWLFALRGIDSLLDTFRYSLKEKLDFIRAIKTAFGNEFGMSRFLKKQLDDKYRPWRKRIDYFLSSDLEHDQGLRPLVELLKERERSIMPIAQKLASMREDQTLELAMNDLLASHIHMFMNRLFRSQNRKFELVIYDFLYRAYDSQHARLKYQNKKA